MNQGRDLRLRSLVIQTETWLIPSSPWRLYSIETRPLLLRTMLSKHIFAVPTSDNAVLVPNINVPCLYNQLRVSATCFRNVINLLCKRGTFIGSTK
jgi:hypothetical protein